MFGVKNIESYLENMGISHEDFAISEVSEGVYTITSSNISLLLEQLDRDEEHPVVMDAVKVFSKVIHQEEERLTVEIKLC